MFKKKCIIKFNLTPTQILVLGFLAFIILGAFLLNLPIASRNGESVGFIDALFTSTSAVCVTGLAVVNSHAHWSVFGKTVILLLIQVGGLGFMTITTTFFILLGRRISLRERLVIQEALNQYTLAGMVRLSRNILLGTLLIEGVGVLLLSIRFIPEYGFGKGLYYSVFHAVSAFCNAGFDIIGNSSLSIYVGDPLVNLTVMGLIILGGIGFTVWMDVLKVSKIRVNKRIHLLTSFRRLSLHAKLVIFISTLLTALGFVFFLVMEGTNPLTLGSMGIKERLLGSLFLSVTPRTAGFNTIPMELMTHASVFMTIILMFIGGSPGGTAGGIKTVTMGVIILEVLSVVRAKEETEVFGRRIRQSTIKRALAVVMISLFIVIGVTMVLSVTENWGFVEIFFETVSAFATVGLSIGGTADLSTVGKLIIAMTMFFGRLGPITLAVAFSIRGHKNKSSIRLPEEQIMVG